MIHKEKKSETHTGLIIFVLMKKKIKTSVKGVTNVICEEKSLGVDKRQCCLPFFSSFFFEAKLYIEWSYRESWFRGVDASPFNLSRTTSNKGTFKGQKLQLRAHKR